MRTVTRPGECCPVCTGSCLLQGTEYQSGSTFTLPSDPCSSCSCLVSMIIHSSILSFILFSFSTLHPFSCPPSDQNEVVNCQKRPCPVQCSHPVPSETCCPICDSCLYEGVVHSHSHTFTASSNPCQRCTCVRGTITCVPLVCPPTPCARPIIKPGQCCPECTGTFYIFLRQQGDETSRELIQAQKQFL